MEVNGWPFQRICRGWESNYDLGLWENDKKLHIFMQKVDQLDGEGLADDPATMVNVLEVSNLPKK